MVFLSIEENTDSQKGYRRCHVVVHKNERFQGFLEVWWDSKYLSWNVGINFGYKMLSVGLILKANHY